MKRKFNKYLIFGSCSALAGYFIERLKKEGKKVFEISSYRVKTIASITDKINQLAPDVILNFAGVYNNNYTENYNINVLIPKNLLDAAREAKFKGKIVLIGSAAEYGIQEKYHERCVGKPQSVYGLTKLMQHSLFQYYASTTQIKMNYIRLFNVIYGRLSDKLFIGTFTKQLKDILRKKANIIKFGGLESYRDYLWVEDVYTGFIRIIEKGTSGEVYNLGMGRSILLRDFVRRVLSVLKLQPKMVTRKIISVGKIDNRVTADIRKVKKIGWKPQFSYQKLIKAYCHQVQRDCRVGKAR